MGRLKEEVKERLLDATPASMGSAAAKVDDALQALKREIGKSIGVQQAIDLIKKQVANLT